MHLTITGLDEFRLALALEEKLGFEDSLVLHTPTACIPSLQSDGKDDRGRLTQMLHSTHDHACICPMLLDDE